MTDGKLYTLAEIRSEFPAILETLSHSQCLRPRRWWEALDLATAPHTWDESNTMIECLDALDAVEGVSDEYRAQCERRLAECEQRFLCRLEEALGDLDMVRWRWVPYYAIFAPVED